MKNFADALGIELQQLMTPMEESFRGGMAVFRSEDGALVYASRNYHTYIGYTPEECHEHGSNLLDVLIHPEDRDKSACRNATNMEPGTQLETEYRIVKKSGEVVWARCSASIVESPLHGHCVMCTFFDITKEHEEADRARRENDLLMNTIPGGVAKLVLGNNFHVRLASDGFYRLTGYTREEYHSEPINGMGEKLIIAKDIPAVYSAIQEQTRKGNIIYVEYRIRRKDGKIAWIAATGTKIGEEDGALVMEGVFLDTTEAKNMERQLLRITNSIPGGVVQLRLSKNGLAVDYASNGFFRMLGHTREEFLKNNGQMSICVLAEDSEELMEQLWKQVSGAGSEICVEYRIRRGDGQVRWCRMDGVSMESGTGLLECVCTDVTEEKQAKQQMEIDEARYRLIFEHTQDIVFDWDMKQDTVFHSAAFEKKFGYAVPLEHALDYLLDHCIHEEDRGALVAMSEALRAGKDYVETEYRIRTKAGHYIWCRTKAAAVFNKNHEAVRAVGVSTDVDHYMKKTEQLEMQARTDLLTGVLNKMTAETEIEEYLSGDGRGGRHAMLLIDIDDFKGVNDTFGHMMGDTVLTEISERIRSQFREQDIIGRIGGDEFAVLISSVSGCRAVEQRAQQLCGVFHHLFADWKTKCRISGSIGIAMYPEDGTAFKELYERADMALYEAKRRGKDRYAFYMK